MIETFNPFWSATDVLATWLLTYFIHSTLLLGAAALCARWLRNDLSIRQLMWKTALFGGLLTTTLQVGFGIEPLGGTWSIDATASSAEPAVTATTFLASGTTAPGTPPYFLPIGGSLIAGRSDTMTGHAPPSSAAPSRTAAARRAFALAWLLIGTILTAALAMSYRRLRRRLSARRELATGAERDALTKLIETSRTRRPVALFVSPQISIPLARGLRRREIYLPERSFTEMSAERRELILAHELAHLERRDPAWLLATRVVEAALCAQPLNRYARRQLQEIAEYRADDWAVRCTGRPIALAKCLTAVAEWTLDPAAWTTAPAMAIDDTRLGRRVHRLLARDYPQPEIVRSRWIVPAVFALLFALAFIVPGVRTAAAAVDRQPAPDSQPFAEGAPRAPESPAAPADTPEQLEFPSAASIAATPDPGQTPSPIAAPAPRPSEPLAVTPPQTPANATAPGAHELGELAAELARLEAEAIERIGFEHIAALAEELADLSRPDPEILAEMTALAEQIAHNAAPEAAALELEVLADALAEEQAVAGETHRLGAEMRGLAASLRSTDQERARLRAEMRDLAERVRPSAEERARIEREIERAHRELDRHRRETEVERHALERRLREERGEIERRIEAEHREIERAIRERQRVSERRLGNESGDSEPVEETQSD